MMKTEEMTRKYTEERLKLARLKRQIGRESKAARLAPDGGELCSKREPTAGSPRVQG